MFCSRKSNDRINKLHERHLRIVYNAYETSLSDFFEKDGSFSAHRANIQILLNEICEVKHNISGSNAFKDILTNMNTDKPLCYESGFSISEINTAYYREKSIKYFGALTSNKEFKRNKKLVTT